MHLPDEHLTSETLEKGIRTRLYQFTAVHKKFADPLNVVVILKFNEKKGKTARIILFSTDTTLAADNLVKYYRLWFQIEFNFRDAKQHWGLEDGGGVLTVLIAHNISTCGGLCASGKPQ